VPPNLLRGLIPQLKTYVSATDISLHSQALSLFALLLQLSPKSTFPEVEREVLEDIYSTAYSPLTSGAALDAVLVFFGALVEADFQIATHVVSSLTRNTLEKHKEVSYPNVAKCVAQVVKSNHALAAGVIAEFSKNLKVRYTSSAVPPSSLTPSSEACRSTGPFLVSPYSRGNWPFYVRLDQTNHLMIIDMLSVICPINMTSSTTPSSSSHQIRKTLGRQQPSLQVSPLSFFSLPRHLTAPLLGNIAIGNLQLFLPFIVHLVKQDDSKRLLALHALKEVVTHTSTSHLENLAETLWVPLFENSESADESSRGVAAACIGKLITTHPARYLPQVHVCIPEFVMTLCMLTCIQARIRDPNAAIRTTVLAAIRYTFADSSPAFDDILAPYIIDFLSLMEDAELVIIALCSSIPTNDSISERPPACAERPQRCGADETSSSSRSLTHPSTRAVSRDGHQARTCPYSANGPMATQGR
jgi:cullin-associated NEDD8-dissociated protein 1